QQRGRNVDSEIRDRRNVDRGWHHNRQDLTDLPPFRKKRAVVRAHQNFGEIHRAGNDYRDANVEWEEARLRPLGTPTDPNLDTSVDSDQRKNGHGNGHADLDTPVGRTRPTGFFYRFIHSSLVRCGLEMRRRSVLLGQATPVLFYTFS